MRNLLGTLLVSAGTPMITAGDEIGRSQGGNNNPYCQDNEISWIGWRRDDWHSDLLETTAYLLRLRAEHPVLRPARFAIGRPGTPGDVLPDLSWFDGDGRAMTPDGWHDPHQRVLQMLRSGLPDGDADALVVLNGSLDQQVVTLPGGRGRDYELVWDSSWERPDGVQHAETDPLDLLASPGESVDLESLSMRIYLAR
ncbi:hypothetical protein [Georgenia sp. SUBG003]|uniref:hypothetical protein n=1 Tax=Georgenia sp. SUBG003 TaxID=1497974 RepID=UPI000693C89C